MAKKGNGDSKEKSAEQIKIAKQIIDLAKKHGIPLQIGQMDPRLQQATPKRDLIVQVRQNQGQVVIDFGQSISWCAMLPEQATKFAASIIKQVQSITGIQASSGEEPPPPEKEEEEEKVDKPE